MRTVVLGLAAPAAAMMVPAAPANAEHWSDPQFVAAANVTVHRAGPPNFTGEFVGERTFRQGKAGRRDRDRDRHRRHRDRDRDFVGGSTVLLGPLDFDSNRSWDPDRWNDWWHERPHRAFPRWMANNQNCDRLWWGGGAWRC